MIESELEKGFDDLSSARVIAMLLSSGKQDARQRGPELFGKNEVKWGSWRPYLVDEPDLLRLCEDFRTIIREHRIDMASLDASKVSARNQEVEAAASAKAREVMEAVRKKGL